MIMLRCITKLSVKHPIYVSLCNKFKFHLRNNQQYINCNTYKCDDFNIMTHCKYLVKLYEKKIKLKIFILFYLFNNK